MQQQQSMLVKSWQRKGMSRRLAGGGGIGRVGICSEGGCGGGTGRVCGEGWGWLQDLVVVA